MILTIALLALTFLAALWTVMTKGLMRSILGLAATSVFVTILMFTLGANLAAVFELSVCAGLITVVLVSTVSMTQSAPRTEDLDRTRSRLRRYWPLPVLMLLSGAVLAYFSAGMHVDLPPPAAASDVRTVLWGSRQTDLLGQVVVVLAGVFGVIVLFKERKK